MWTFCDDAGIHPASSKRLKMEVFPADPIAIEEIDAMLGELLSQGLIRRYTAKGADYFVVTGWHHQRIEKPRYNYPKPPNIKEVHDNSANGSGQVADKSATHLDRPDRPDRPDGPDRIRPDRMEAGPDLYERITTEHLQDTTRLLDWVKEVASTKSPPIKDLERDQVLVLAAAEHCLKPGAANNPSAMFVSLITGRKWKDVSSKDKSAGLARLKAHQSALTNRPIPGVTPT